MKKALIVYGGWDGHEPEKVAGRFSDMLKKHGYQVELSNQLETFGDVKRLKTFDLLVPVWTMDKISNDLVKPILEAVASGVGLAGCHGGMCDAFRENVEWQFMTGGQWVAHPGGDGVVFRVEICDKEHSIVKGIADFDVATEHYYLHVDPVNHVLATTRFPLVEGPHTPNGEVMMPVAWTKMWGQGRVFYNALGHHADVFDVPEAALMMERGLVWAAEGAIEARNSTAANA